MKKLLVALILVVVLSVTLATPAFAWGPWDPDNRPGKAGLENALPNISWCLPLGFSFGPGQRQVLPDECRAYGSWIARVHVWRAIKQDCPPGQTVP